MHYLIDGYNLLFRLLHDEKDLQSEREAIIYDLNKKISLIHLNASIVFDAAFQVGGRSRSHFDALEILYTAQGESADDYILDEIQNSPSPHQETVVTSDKKLARQVRLCSGHTESVEDFIQWLNRSYKNKLRQANKEKQAPEPRTPLQKPATTRPIFPEKGAPLETYTDYYAGVFEAEWQEIQKVERLVKESIPASAPLKRPPRKPRPKNDPFAEHPSEASSEATEMERWLKIFEERLKNGRNKN